MSTSPPVPSAPVRPRRDGKTALILSGGGARAAYQVGVLQALQLIRRDAGERRRGNPFHIITGT